MKTNLKILLISIALLVGVTANAQDKKITAGVKAGMNVSNFSGDSDGADAKIGFNVGVTVDYAFTDEFYLLTGLDLTTKGAKASGDIDEYGYSGHAKITMNPMYLQLPIHLGYKLSVAENTKIVFRAGPYVAYGVGGKVTAKVGGQKGDTNVFRTGGLKNFDFGFGIGTGAEFGKIGVNLGYNFGVINIADSSEGTLRNGNFSIGLGYKF